MFRRRPRLSAHSSAVRSDRSENGALLVLTPESGLLREVGETPASPAGHLSAASCSPRLAVSGLVTGVDACGAGECTVQYRVGAVPDRNTSVIVCGQKGVTRS